MTATQKFLHTIYLAPQKDVWCRHGARYEEAPNFFSHDILIVERSLFTFDHLANMLVLAEMSNLLLYLLEMT